MTTGTGRINILKRKQKSWMSENKRFLKGILRLMNASGWYRAVGKVILSHNQTLPAALSILSMSSWSRGYHKQRKMYLPSKTSRFWSLLKVPLSLNTPEDPSLQALLGVSSSAPAAVQVMSYLQSCNLTMLLT